MTRIVENNNKPKITVVTVTYNAEKFLKDCIESIIFQNYDNIEYIVIDGNSEDNTLEIINKYWKRGLISKYISEKDNGLYDAMNKGINLANGDIISFLNADDLYFDNTVLKKVAQAFKKDIDFLYGDIVYIKRNKDEYFRYWKTGKLDINKLKYGWQIPHPSFFVKTSIAKKIMFNTKYKIAADHDFIIRVIKNYKKYDYINYPLVKMRFGGESTKNLKNMKNGNKEIKEILIKNEIKPSKLYYFYRISTRINQILKSKKYLKEIGGDNL